MMYSTQIAILILLNYNWNLFSPWESKFALFARKWIEQIIFLIIKKMTRDFFSYFNQVTDCPSIGSKLFWTGPHILDRFQNVKFSSKNLFLDWSRTFWTHPK